MDKRSFLNIVHYIASITLDTTWENHVYVVGGAVRDFILGSEIKDIDLVIDIHDGGIKFAEWMHEKGYTNGSVVTYPTYGTAMFRLAEYPDVELECVQTRGEQYHDKNSRKPETCYASIEEDAFRRDLTINALFMRISDGKILDVTEKGLEDIKNHVIRITNENPDIVYIDDPLRQMRTIRFSCRLGWGIENETYEALKRNADRLSIISKERIQDELCKILLTKDARRGMEMLKDTGLLVKFIPEFTETFDMTQNVYHDFCTVWEHTLKVVENASEETLEKDEKLLLMLSALLHDIGKTKTMTVEEGKVHFYNHEFKGEEIARTIMKRLRFSNDITDEVCFMIKNHMRYKSVGDKTPKDKSIRKFQFECKTEKRFNLTLRLIHADNRSHGKDFCLPYQAIRIVARSKQLMAEGEDMFEYKLPINGDEIMEFKHIQPGPTVKQYHDYLIKLAYNGIKKLTKDECYRMIKNYSPSQH